MSWSWENIDWSATAACGQAVLSAAGIVVAAYIAATVARIPILSTRHQRLAALVSMADVARGVLQAAQTESDTSRDGDPLLAAFDLARFDRTISALGGVSMLDVSPGVLVEGLLILQENLARARVEMADFLENAPSGIGLRDVTHFYEGAIDQVTQLRSDIITAAMAAAHAEKHWWRP